MWYVFQLAVITYVLYIYTVEIPHPNENTGHVLAFGILIAYCLTWIITKSFDLLCTGARKLTRYRTTQKLQHRRLIDR
jgi:hypothetical protein